MLQSIATSIDTVMTSVTASVDRGLAIAAAARVLETEASSAHQHEKLANMLRICASGLAAHPQPAFLCERNADRLNEECRGDRHLRWPPEMNATQVALAAEAFDAAGRILRRAGVE